MTAKLKGVIHNVHLYIYFMKDMIVVSKSVVIFASMLALEINLEVKLKKVFLILLCNWFEL